MSKSVYTRQQFWGTFEEKEAEVGGIMPISTLPNAKPDKGAKHVIPKTGSAPAELGKEAAVATFDELQQAVKGEQDPKNPQAQPISPRVDVSQKEPPKLIKEKQAQHLAMPSIGRFPLDSYTQVKQASAYFEEYRGQFSPVHRREYCLNLVKRAEALGIPMSDEVQKYGGVGYAALPALEIALEGRRSLIVDEDHQALLGKLAEARPTLSPDGFAATLAEFDKLVSIDHLYDREIMDPYLSTFGKTAEVSEDGSHVLGNDIVSNSQLKEFADTPCNGLGHYGPDFVKEFKKDPVGVFSSLPVDQKKLISRQANEPIVDS